MSYLQKKGKGMPLSDIFGGLKKSANVFLGSPEAEAEATEKSRIPLLQVYEDFHGISDALSAEKFIVVARKGCGKSAFAEFVTLRSRQSATIFSKFIRRTEVALEQLVQYAGASAGELDATTFFRWLIYVNLLSMLATSEAAKADVKFSHLRQFLERNSGYVDIREFEIKEIAKKHGLTVSTDAFQKYFRAKYNQDLNIKSERAPFYRLLPHLEKVLVDLLSSNLVVANENSFYIFFDDLDLTYGAANSTSENNLMDLLRVCKEINNEILGSSHVQAKVVILLRDDIESDLNQKFADAAKVFSSYACRITWYQEKYSKLIEEDDLYLKRFIVRRIRLAFAAIGRKITSDDVWSSLVKADGSGNSSFKYVLNKTLFRPRDLLLFFKPLENGYYSFPLDGNSLRMLSREYSSELAKELKNEMALFFNAKSIDGIFAALGKINRGGECSYDSAVSFVAESVTNHDPKSVVQYLYDRSIIGNMSADGRFTFKCRQSANQIQTVNIDKSQKIVVQYGTKDYLDSRGY